MTKKLIGLIGGLVVLGVIAGGGWFLASPLFFDDVVDEEFPGQLPDAATLSQMPAEELEAIEAESLQVAAAMPDKVMDEPMPEEAAAPTVVLQGQFQDADSFHQGSGLATIYQLPDGAQVLRLQDFEVTNGPDLHVLLVEHPAPTSRAEVQAGYLDLGSLKGNVGSQNYNIPAGTDIAKYNTVMIYCMPFHVIFSTASLG